MDREKFSSILLHTTFFIVLFYPFKGLLSASLSLVVGADISNTIIRFTMFFTLFFIFLNVFVNNITFLAKSDKLLFYIGLLGILAGVVLRDNPFVYNTVLLFGLPVVFTEFRKISDANFYKFTFTFFSISTVYMLAEHVIVHPNSFGLNISPPTTEQISSYLNYLFSSSKAVTFTTDFRHIGSFNRTSGYLGNLLAMPVFLSMAAIFYYVIFREKPKPVYFIFSITSCYLLLVSLSTTAIIAFFVTVLFYEVFVRRSYKSFIIVFIIIFLGIIIYILYTPAGVYIFNRLIFNINNPNYFNTFFDYSWLAKPLNLLYLFVGKWNWKTPPGVSSHIDFVLISLTYGGFISFLLYKRMMRPVLIAQKSENKLLKIFSITLLPAIICLYHHYMTLNINVMFVFTLLMLRSNEICLREGKAYRVNLPTSI